jgi:hypothetical protein
VFIKTHMLKYFAITVLSHDKDWESEGELPWNWIAVADFSSYTVHNAEMMTMPFVYILWISVCVFGWLWNLYDSTITFITDWHSSANRNLCLDRKYNLSMYLCNEIIEEVFSVWYMSVWWVLLNVIFSTRKWFLDHHWVSRTWICFTRVKTVFFLHGNTGISIFWK